MLSEPDKTDLTRPDDLNTKEEYQVCAEAVQSGRNLRQLNKPFDLKMQKETRIPRFHTSMKFGLDIPPEAALYELSYIYLGAMATLSCVIVGLLVSFVTGT
ncbi:hypothetical protein Bbelb_040790 [Branchiostoma belcheri]|nr:hypothetical protein Bbelb_040790 [Branchiostoma belcheri]